MQILPPALTDLIEAFGLLPGVGPRTAERYAYYLVRHASDAPENAVREIGIVKVAENTFKKVVEGFYGS